MSSTQTSTIPGYLKDPLKDTIKLGEQWADSNGNRPYGTKPGESLYTEMNGMQTGALGNASWLADQDLNEMFGLNKSENTWDSYANAGPELIDSPDFNYKITQGLGYAGDVNNPNFSYDVTKGTGAGMTLDEARYGRAAPTLSTKGVMDESGPLGAVASYMSPYLQQVLDPQIREIQQESERQRRSIGAGAAMAGAFGDARHGIMEGENFEKTNQAVSDATGRTMADAFLNAMTQRQTDMSRFDNMSVQDAGLTENAQARKLATGQSNQSAAEQALQRALQGDISTGQFKQAGATLGLDADKSNQAAKENQLRRQLEGDIQSGQFALSGAQLGQTRDLANQASRQNATERLGTAAQAYQSIGNNSLQNFMTANDTLMNAGNFSQAQEEQKRKTQQALQEAIANKDYNTAAKMMQLIQGAPKEGTVTTESNDGLLGILGSVIGGIF